MPWARLWLSIKVLASILGSWTTPAILAPATRVEKALQARIDKAGVKDRSFKHRLFGSDNFDKSALTRQAHRDVQHDHARRMSQLASGETRELDALVSTAEQRDATKQELREKARDDFQRATDRRAGSARRR